MVCPSAKTNVPSIKTPGRFKVMSEVVEKPLIKKYSNEINLGHGISIPITEMWLLNVVHLFFP